MSSFPSLDVDREACENIANACASSALAGIFVGAALTLARGRPASVLPTYALNTCANFTLVGTTYATALEANVPIVSADYVRALAWVDDATLAVGAWDSAVHLEAV